MLGAMKLYLVESKDGRKHIKRKDINALMKEVTDPMGIKGKQKNVA